MCLKEVGQQPDQATIGHEIKMGSPAAVPRNRQPRVTRVFILSGILPPGQEEWAGDIISCAGPGATPLAHPPGGPPGSPGRR